MSKPQKAAVLTIAFASLGLGVFLVMQSASGRRVVEPPPVAPESAESQGGGPASPASRTGMRSSGLEGEEEASAGTGSEALASSSRVEIDDVLQLHANDDLCKVEAYIRERITPDNLAIWNFKDLLQHILSQQDYELANEDAAIKASLYKVMETAKQSLRRGFSERGGTINSLGVQLLDRGLASRYSSKPKDEAYLCHVHRNGRNYKIWVRAKDSPELLAINSGLALATETFVQNFSRELYRWRKRLK